MCLTLHGLIDNLPFIGLLGLIDSTSRSFGRFPNVEAQSLEEEYHSNSQ